MPSGSPIALAPLLVGIELVSHLAKAVSLGARLVANITAGHLLFCILSGFAFKMMIAGGVITILSIFPILIVLFITVLEMAVALIQAYVFSILTAIYINDAVHIH
jgi:F-type H+-transporting ATPase subunit a